MREAPQLLVAWEPRWSSFKTSVSPALARLPGYSRNSEYHLASWNRSFAASLTVHLIGLALFVLARNPLVHEPALWRAHNSSETITYFVGRELPNVNDQGGTKAGPEGSWGGRQRSAQQTIKIMVSQDLRDLVVKAPELVPKTNTLLANLLAIKAAAPALPATALTLPQLPIVRGPEPLIAKPRPTEEEIAPPMLEQTASTNHLVVSTAVLGPDSIPTLAAPTNLRVPITAQVITMPTTAVVLPAPTHVSGSFQALSSVGLHQLEPNKVVVPEPSIATGTIEPVRIGELVRTTVVVSATPGLEIGRPRSANGGSASMSPSGKNQTPGIGQKGEGSGLRTDTGPGSTGQGEAQGSSFAAVGSGPPSGRSGGISESPGPGGAGNAAVTTGISISGSKVNIPSFASAVPMLPNIAVPLGPRRAPAVTIIATSRSGGALNRYGVLKGGKIYTIYIPTSAGNVVLQFAARTRGRATFEEDLTAPEALFATVPPRLSRARYLVAAVLDTAGLLKDVQLLEGEVSTFSTVFITDLQKWRFRPVLRNGKPISVNAVLGFNVGTQ